MNQNNDYSKKKNKMGQEQHPNREHAWLQSIASQNINEINFKREIILDFYYVSTYISILIVSIVWTVRRWIRWRWLWVIATASIAVATTLDNRRSWNGAVVWLIWMTRIIVWRIWVLVLIILIIQTGIVLHENLVD